ncbi:MAG: glycoside hydrolase family 65 protein, partial [Tangfeifania sp.]
MKDYIIHNEWKIIEEGFNAENNRISESIFSIGNGKMGQRANFEEHYSGDSLQGAYIAGIYYPDKTRVGWWKNGYPEYFAKIINSTNWIGIDISVEGETLDLAKTKVEDFRRELDMKEGILSRSFVATMQGGKKLEVKSMRFLSIDDTEIGAIRYSLKALNFSGEITITPYLDGDVKNEDANYNEKFWTEITKEIKDEEGYLTLETLKTRFQVTSGMWFRILRYNKNITDKITNSVREKYIEATQKI